MAAFKNKTKGNVKPNGKPRVYFTCHPMDFDVYFEKLTDDILNAHDCAIYYTPDMTEVIEEELLDTDLGQFNMFVVPVTRNLLTSPCRAMYLDIAYAKNAHTPILPLMTEAGLEKAYSDPSMFGNLQYLEPFAADRSQISYNEKLKKFLGSVLFTDEQTRRIRAAFSAYIFLSYRKKDRHHANKLMKLIHNNPECQDIAIWFDEFLTPGENFMEGIEKALDKSQLFTLLVTPNLLEEVDGKPNFVMAQEYPAAKNSGKIILPVEMSPTDKILLAEKFHEIPDCVVPGEEISFRKQLLQAIERQAISPHTDDSEHNFLVGLAYIEGIDVEIDRLRGIQLITSAAEAGLPEAMKHLMDIYADGIVVVQSLSLAAFWGEKLVAHYEHTEIGPSLNTVNALVELADLLLEHYTNNDNYLEQSLDVYEKALSTYELIHPQPDDYYIRILFGIANALNILKSEKEVSVREHIYELHQIVYGPTHEKTIRALGVLGSRCRVNKLMVRAIALLESALHTAKEHLGTNHTVTLYVMHELAFAYSENDRLEEAALLCEYICEHRSTEYASDRQSLARTLFNLAYIHADLENPEEAVKYFEKSYSMLKTTPYSTIDFTDTLKRIYKRYGLHDKLISLLWELHEEYVRKEGPSSYSACSELKEIVDAYRSAKNYEKALDTLDKIYNLNIRFDTWSLDTTLKEIANVYDLMGRPVAAEMYREKASVFLHLHTNFSGSKYHISTQNVNYTGVNPFDWDASSEGYAAHIADIATAQQQYEQNRESLGRTHKDTLYLLGGLAVAHFRAQDYNAAMPYMQEIVNLRCSYMEKGLYPRISAMKMLSDIYRGLGLNQEAAELDKRIREEESVFPEVLPDSPQELNYLLKSHPNLTWEQVSGIHEKRYQIWCSEQGPLSKGAIYELYVYAESARKYGDLEKAVQLLQQVHETASSILGSNYLLVVDPNDILRNLTKCYRDLGNKEKWLLAAEEHFAFQLKYRTDFSEDTFDALLEAYQKTGNSEKANELVQTVCEQITSRPAASDDFSYRTYRKLKSITDFYKKTGEIQLAISLWKSELVRLSTKNDSKKYESFAYHCILEQLGMVHLHTGNYRKAAALLEVRYHNFLQKYGKEDRSSVSALQDYALACSYLDDHEKTLQLQNEAYKLECKLSGYASPGALTQLHNLSVCYGNAGNHQKALELSLQAYDISYKYFGERNLKTIRELYTIAVSYSWLDDWNAALTPAQRAVDLYTQVLGKDNPKTKTAEQCLAIVKEKLSSENE